MGKNRKRKQRNDDRSKDISQNMKITPVTANEKSRQPYSSQSNISLPRSFPSNLSRPFNDFLRDEDPFKESFRSALNTSYEGFVVDEDIGNEGRVQNFLEQILANKLFRKDVTQPFGLGTKCALTYVTRCLLGEPGTTYKYLGLRMFAHPWKKTEVESLGKTLTERTKQHLQTLSNTRSERGSPGTKCRPKFDICLINRMESSVDLKDEPTIGNAKTSVSWHADSSLEHYSTIAVYQTLLLNNNKHQKKKEKKKKTDDDDKEGKWFVALRVAHHSEGPQSSRRGADIESSIVKNTPPIAVSLPSGSAYYLLDDFNHHHQHTVLTNGDMESAGIRYSCTYRLLRDSHNVEHMTGRCQAAISNFHKKGSKLWRSEQLLLSELENEWIRQFYIQGSQHRDLLWSSWKEPIQKLLRFWSQLERRTNQIVELLRAASEARCGFDSESNNSDSKPSRTERKARERRRKALTTIEDLLARHNLDKGAALDQIYKPLAELIEQRATMRERWQKREKDHLFRELKAECRPLAVPFRFNVEEGTKQIDEECGFSPMKGSPLDLSNISINLRALGNAYQSMKLSDLPVRAVACKKNRSKGSEVDEHRKGLKWAGWADDEFGLELQEPWAAAVVEGRKPIETRSYDLPPSLLGKRILIIQSPALKPGVSAMRDEIDFFNDSNGAKVIGWCTFDSVRKYTTQEAFEADEREHLVTQNSGYGWKKGRTKVVYGWIVGSCKAESRKDILSGIRRMRSLFEIKKKEKGTSSNLLKKNSNQIKKQRGRKDVENNQGKKKWRRY